MARIKAISGVDGIGSSNMIAWVLIAGVTGLIFWATTRPARKAG